MSNICNLCDKQFVYDRKQKGTKATCPSCMANRHRWHLKAVMVEYKGGKCQLCGYNHTMRSLDFHHVDPSSKAMGFGANHNRSWQSVRDELDKCVCLCRNCHGEVEEALELVEWGHAPLPILDRVNKAHAAYQPRVIEFSREGWEKHHPKFLTPTVMP